MGEGRVITKETVFVLGAGASQPFAFPLGSELKKRVLGNYRNEQGNAVHLYNTTPFTSAQVSQFIERGLAFRAYLPSMRSLSAAPSS
jgi:hypothetical protein